MVPSKGHITIRAGYSVSMRCGACLSGEIGKFYFTTEETTVEQVAHKYGWHRSRRYGWVCSRKHDWRRLTRERVKEFADG